MDSINANMKNELLDWAKDYLVMKNSDQYSLKLVKFEKKLQIK